ncbi:MAG: hypothetical protein HY741_27585 [Chloroflexi bacterium]|nr:hypothetical protein [Chloroflexota bacterium]
MLNYETRLRDFTELLKEAGQYYMSRGAVYETLRRLTQRLDQENIPYALLGGLALGAHGFIRMTDDVDILLTRAGLAAFRDRCMGRGYVPAFPNAQKTFRDTETQVRIEFLTTGEYPGDGKPKAVSFPDPEDVYTERAGIRVITVEKLIELKLASGMTAPHRLRDLADVQDLIVALKLEREFAEQLDESVREEYRKLWDAAQSGASEARE